jgi:hypothetical protein
MTFTDWPPSSVKVRAADKVSIGGRNYTEQRNGEMSEIVKKREDHDQDSDKGQATEQRLAGAGQYC